MIDPIKQNAKGENITQNIYNVHGNLVQGVTPEQVVGIIEEYGVVKKECIVEIVRKVIDSIDIEQRSAPEKRVFVKILQNMSLSLEDDVLKNAFSALLKSSMKFGMNSKLHPAYIEILNQMCADEVKLFNSLNPTSDYPLINLRLKKDNVEGDGFLCVANFTDVADLICEYPLNIGPYLENLDRLKLIEIDTERLFVDESIYDRLKNHPFIKKEMEIRNPQKMPNISFAYDQFCFHMTSFGKNFWECVKQ